SGGSLLPEGMVAALHLTQTAPIIQVLLRQKTPHRFRGTGLSEGRQLIVQLIWRVTTMKRTLYLALGTLVVGSFLFSLNAEPSANTYQVVDEFPVVELSMPGPTCVLAS